MSQEQATYSAFISYASDDREKADEICQSLEQQGFRCWIAPRDVRAGRDYGEEIIRGIGASRCLVLVLSDAANHSTFVKREVERAVSKRKPVFPVRIEEVLPSPAIELFVSTTHWIDAWRGSLASHVEQLARDLSDESVMAAATEQSRRIARRRQLPRWIGAAVGLFAIIAAVVVGNVLTSRLAGPTPENLDPIVDRTPVTPLLDIDTAMQRLDRAVEAADLSDRGQVEALHALLAAGQSYAGAVLRGVRFREAVLSGHSFEDADFSGSDLTQARLQGSDLSGARLWFGILSSAYADEAKAIRLRAPFLTAEDSTWRGVDATQAIFFGSRLRGADFRGADLRGADLTFCDLRDANFEDANLEGTFFIGSVMTGARFDGARFGDTDVTGAAIDLDRLTAGQLAGVGRTPGARGEYLVLRVDLFEEIPTSRFTGGIENRPLIGRPWAIPGFADQNLPLCGPRSLLPSASWPVLQTGEVERLSDHFGMSFDQAFLQTANRRSQFLQRVADQESFLQQHLAGTQSRVPAE